jgi:hypothetical protein
LVFALSTGLTGQAAWAGTGWQIVPPSQEERLFVALPPLAIVESRDGSGKTWQVSGRVSGSPSVALEDFKLCLLNQGWRLDKVIALGKDGQRASSLYLWKKGKQGIILMLWEEKPGRSRFALGLDKQTPNASAIGSHQ